MWQRRCKFEERGTSERGCVEEQPQQLRKTSLLEYA
jgi:hypothetical protein